MIDPDYFVAAVSIGAGLALLFGSVMNNERLMQATVPQMLTFRLGATKSRILIAILGLVFIAIGAWLVRPKQGEPKAVSIVLPDNSMDYDLERSLLASGFQPEQSETSARLTTL